MHGPEQASRAYEQASPTDAACSRWKCPRQQVLDMNSSAIQMTTNKKMETVKISFFIVLWLSNDLVSYRVDSSFNFDKVFFSIIGFEKVNMKHHFLRLFGSLVFRTSFQSGYPYQRQSNSWYLATPSLVKVLRGHEDPLFQPTPPSFSTSKLPFFLN